MGKASKEILDLSFLGQEGEDAPSRKANLGWDAALIENARVMVVGAGALGNEVLKNLALIGVKNILIVDFDVVEKTNLAKSVLYRERDCTGEKHKVEIAVERLKDLNPKLKLMAINGDATLDVGLGVFRKMDVVIGCLDNRMTRMWLNRYCFALGKPWVDGGILSLEGQVDVYAPGVNCYECGLGPRALELIEYRNGCVNRMKRYASAGLANTNAIVASIVGAVQVQEALKLIADPSRSLAGHQFYFNGRSNYYDKLGKATPRRATCRSHIPYAGIVEAPLSAEHSVAETLEWLAGHFNTRQISILLHHQVVLKAATGQSEKVKRFVKARPHVTEADLDGLREIPEEEVRFLEWTDTVDAGFPYPELRLRDIGVPPYHILQVIAEGKKNYVELSADERFLKFE
ncbi:MAG: ThiF family adenylyltransferase [Phaeodactylibacter sp.]|nr:ThiF family adenylyltransferase [Phaeodactylibacter sp.]MCB9294565.1 ThiF family adenylyltransferase [Lewinellaceae bacterium]